MHACHQLVGGSLLAAAVLHPQSLQPRTAVLSCDTLLDRKGCLPCAVQVM